jgi:uncharacterized protein YceK
MRAAILLLVVALLVAGCGSSKKSSNGQPVPFGGTAAPITVSPQTTSPGHRIRVTLQAQTTKVTVTLTGKGGHVRVNAKRQGANHWRASLTVPRTMHGGFWPVIASYTSGQSRERLRTQVKVFTP